jgi:Asp-tRNA(Asn)/Glu-tRNA(Gln) amidotransferase A subunit family amidase
VAVSSEPLTITAAAPLIRSGELTPSDLLEQCLRRIDIYEPAVKAWAYLDRERARQEAAKATDEIKAGHYRGPLHGIPVGIKDIIDVFDMPTGCGSKLWANSYARRDATCVERLRQAGAIILGKTVTTAYAYLDPPPTRNPWNLERTPGGSSSGSAAAVACGMCLAALGTQTGGSTIRPASYCGVCALKPTWGRVSVDGVLPLAPSLDHIGVMANCVRDLAVVFEAIAEPDPGHSYPIPEFSAEFPVKPDPLVFGRIGGVFRERADPITQAFLKDGVAERCGMGGLATKMDGGTIPVNVVEVVDRLLPVGFNTVHTMHKRVMAAEAEAVHAGRRVRHPDDYPSHITALCEFGRQTNAAALVEAYAHRDALRREMLRLFDTAHALICPAATGSAPEAETTGDPSMNSPWSYLGLPVMSVPFEFSPDELPLAVQLVGKQWNETELLGIAVEVERWGTFPRRLPPVPAV